MKRLVSILLLLVFLFNIGGYYLVFIGLAHRSDRLLSRKIDQNQVDESQIVQLKIPVSLPYPIQQRGFERVDGRIEHQGHFYKLVKQKLEHDTLFIVCVRDVDSKQLADTFKEYGNKANDLPADAKNAKNLLSKFLKDFEPHDAKLIHHGSGWLSTIAFGELTTSLLSPAASHITPPPKA